MKKSLTIIVVFFVLCSITVLAATPAPLAEQEVVAFNLEPDKSKLELVKEIFGQPYETIEDGLGYCYKFNQVTIWTERNSDLIYRLLTNDPNHRTSRDIGIGDTVGQLFTAYGEPHFILTYPDRVVYVYFVSNQLRRISFGVDKNAGLVVDIAYSTAAGGR